MRIPWLAAALFALFGAGGVAHAADLVVHVGELGILADAPFYIAVDAGYFAQQGLTVVLDRFDSAAQGSPALATNRIQVLGGGVSASLFNAFARNWPVQIAMARTRDVPAFSSDTIVLRADLKDSVKTFKDLKGKRIGVNAPYSSLHYMLAKALEENGMSLSDVEIVYMPWPDMASALATHSLDAAMVVEPFASQFSERNLAAPFLRAADIFRDPPLEVSVILFNKDWASQQPDQARRFTIAYLQAARDYYDAMRGGPKRAQVVETIMSHTLIKDRGEYDRIQWSYVDPNGALSVQSLSNQQAWYVKQGVLADPVDIAKAFNPNVLDSALSVVCRVDVH